LAGALSFLYGGALICAWLTPFSWVLQSLLSALILLHAWQAVSYHVLGRHPLCGGEIVLSHERVLLGNGEEAKIEDNSYAQPYLVVLNLKLLASGRRCSLVLFGDALDAETFRHLRTRLRHPLREKD
jgi:hypothetical protein